MLQTVLKHLCQFLLAISAFSNLACTVNTDDLSASIPSAEILQLADEAKNKKMFIEAGAFFMEVDKLYPYSDESRIALVGAMKAYHDGGDLMNARLSAKRYLTLYPGGPDAAFSRYMVGLSFFDAIVDVQRDQGAALHAIKEFQILISEYPKSKYSVLASEKFSIAYSQLAGQEMSVGRYYMKRDGYLAAINRFSIVVEGYSDTIFAVEAFYRLTESYIALGMINLAEKNDILLQKQYPKSEWSFKSKKLISKFN